MALDCLRVIEITPMNPGVVKRFAEDVDIPVLAMQEQLLVSPRDFQTGIVMAVGDWRRSGERP